MSILRSQADFRNELQDARRQSPKATYRTGTVNLSERIVIPSPSKLVYLRCRFSVPHGMSAPALPVFSNLTIDLDSLAGDEYDVLLYTVNQRGYGRDCNLILASDELQDPSPWTFNVNDALIVSWSNLDEIRWGLEVGIASL